jgi:glutaredoxin-like protein
MMSLLNESITKQVKDVFDGQLTGSVDVLFFGSKKDCEYCSESQQLIEEIVDISDKLSIKVYDLQADAAIAAQYKIERVPGIVLLSRQDGQPVDYGIRYSGIPSGHEFSSLIHDLVLVSGQDSGLSQPTRDQLKQLDQPVHLMVFVTPTCPYCPRAVVLAHQMAMESPYVTAEMVEAMEFQELSTRFSVGGVPQTTINEGAGTVVGAVPEEHLLSEINRALRGKK